MKVVIVGSSGVIGRHLSPRLEALGHEVCGPRVDIFDAEELAHAFAGADVVINLASRVPRLGTGSDYTMNDKIRRKGILSLIEACRKARTPRLLQQSISFMMAGGDQIMTEQSAESATSASASAVDMENHLENSSLDWIVLRDGLLYGPGTGRDTAWRDSLKKRECIPGTGDDYISLIHVADLAEAFVAALGAFDRVERTNRIFAVVDDRPLTYRELFERLAHETNLPTPAVGGPLPFPSFRVSNARARSELGWKPFYRTVWSGLAC